MRNPLYLLFAFACVISLTACTCTPNSNTLHQEQAKRDKQTQAIHFDKSLILYFSMPETNQPDNISEEEDNSTVVVDKEVLGNTQFVAMGIQKYTGGDLLRIAPQSPYPTDHEELVELASKEQEEATRPLIKDKIKNFEQYETIFIGYPIWWSDMPMILYTLFDEYDFQNKTIIPFSTHGGSGLADTIKKIQDSEPNADVYTQGLSISRNDVENSSAVIKAWLKAIPNNE